MILDVIVILLALVAVFIGCKLGVIRMLLVLIGNIISVVISTLLSDFLTPVIYDSYIGPKIIESLSQSVSVSTQNYISAIDELPLLARISMNLAGYSVESFQNNYVGDLSLGFAQAIESTLSPVVLSLLSIVMTGIIFSLVYLIYRVFVMRVLLKVFTHTFLSWINILLGGLCGLLVIVTLISLFAFLLRTISPYVLDMPILLSESTIYNSYIFYHFYSGNIFSKVISIF